LGKFKEQNVTLLTLWIYFPERFDNEAKWFRKIETKLSPFVNHHPFLIFKEPDINLHFGCCFTGLNLLKHYS